MTFVLCFAINNKTRVKIGTRLRLITKPSREHPRAGSKGWRSVGFILFGVRDCKEVVIDGTGRRTLSKEDKGD